MNFSDTPRRRLLDWCMVLFILVFTVVQLFSHFEFTNKYLEYLDLANTQDKSIAAVYDFLETTNTLSSDMCQYAFSGDVSYLNHYFSVLNSEDRAAILDTLRNSDCTVSFSKTVEKKADSIIERELHILKLTSAAINLPENQMDETLRSRELSEAEKALSSEELIQLARNLSFGDEYRTEKAEFGELLQEYADKFIHDNEILLAQYSEDIEGKTGTQQLLLLLSGVLMLLIVILLYRQMLLINKMFVSEQQYKGALITDAIGVFEVNLTEDRIEAVLSEKDEKITKELMSRKLLVPCSFSEFLGIIGKALSPADAESFERLSPAYFINQFNNNNRFITRENWYISSDERHLYLRSTILLSRHPDSENVYALIAFRDSTTEKLEYEKQQQLVELSLRSGQQYLEALRTDSVGIYETNITTGTLEHIISDTPDHKIGLFFEAVGIRLPGSSEAFRNAILPFLEENQRKNLIPYGKEKMIDLYNKGIRNQVSEFWITLPGGDRRYLKNTMLLRREEGSGDLISIVIVKDFTENQLEIEERQLELLKQKASNEAKTKFFSTMSHDIRTPLNGIIGMMDLVRHHTDEPERIRDYVEKMEQSSKHLLSLVNDVLDMSVIDSGKYEVVKKPLNINALLEECIAVLKSQILMRDIAFTYDDGKLKTPVVLSDAVALKKIIMNILGNAVKFTQDGGKIRFKTDYAYSSDSKTVNARFTISDTGIGMSEEFLERLFEPFAQEDKGPRTDYQGTGLGMSIVKQYVDLLDGTIYVESKKNEGSTFTVELPFEISMDSESFLKESGPDTIDVKGLNVLLVDDNELNIEIVQLLLEDQEVTVTTASNGRDAVDIFSGSEEQYFDAIIMDIMMPIMDGVEATKAIRRMAMTRKDAETIPIIALTANAFTEDLKKTEAAGMNAHLSKPIVPNVLMQTLTRCCRKS